MELVTSQGRQSALPDAWIDRLFQRFSLMYGKDWNDKWANIPLAEVKASWAADLAFASADQLRQALDHCKANNKFAPSCPEFVGLCRAFAPSRESARRLPEPRSGTMPDSVRAEIAKFLNPDRKRDAKDWAREILDMESQGMYRDMYGIDCAKRALGLTA